VALGKWTEGSITLGPNASAIITKFCFDFLPGCPQHACPNPPGQWEFTLAGNSGFTGKPKLLLGLFDDEYFSFPEVVNVWDQMPCAEKLKHAKWSAEPSMGQITGSHGWGMKVPLTQQVRPRWWYMGVFQCGDGTLEELKYKVHMLNTLRTEAELSSDAFWVVPSAMVFVLAFGGLTAWQLRSSSTWLAFGSREIPFAVKLLNLSVGLFTMGLLCRLAHWTQYVEDGKGLMVLQVPSRVMMLLSKQLCIAMLLQLSRALSLSRNPEGPLVVPALYAFTLLCLALELWGDYAAERNYDTHYVYDTMPGMVAVSFDLYWLKVYLTQLRDLWDRTADLRQRAYCETWGVAFASYFAILPVLALLGHLFSPWVRREGVFMVGSSLQFIFHLAFCIAFAPERAVRFFRTDSSELQGLCLPELEGEGGRPVGKQYT